MRKVDFSLAVIANMHTKNAPRHPARQRSGKARRANILADSLSDETIS
jgi:hypothetical protein